MGLKERMEAKAARRAEDLKEQERLMRESAQAPEYNEKGLIKRKGFKMGQQINYGQEFEEENFDRIFKPAIIFLVAVFLLFIVGGIVLFVFIRSGQLEPWLLELFK